MHDPLASHRPIKKIAYDLDAIEAMKKSRGWTIMVERLAGEEQAAIKVLAENPQISRELLDFNRAALRVVRLLKSWPDVLINEFENEKKFAENVEALNQPVEAKS